jgi:SAM-dependent methyltransferase
MVLLAQGHNPLAPTGPDAESFAETFFAHDGNISDKWEQYLSIYESELRRFRAAGRGVRLLEIGVQNGGSLQLWADYLPQGSSIVGVDVDPKCAELHFGKNIKVIVGDATDHASLDSHLGSQRFDIIIDDGSHHSKDIIATFLACFSRLDPGGIYVVEDLHCSYFTSHGGGLRKPHAAVEWLKSLVDALNADHIPDETIGPEEISRLREFGREIARITFYDSAAVIEKLPERKSQPFRRIMTGRHGPVIDSPSMLNYFSPRDLTNLVLPEPTANAFMLALVQKIAAVREELTVLRAALDDANTKLTSLSKDHDAVVVAYGSLVDDWESYLDEISALRKAQTVPAQRKA